MIEVKCPYCGQELSYTDYYGHYLGNDTWIKKGDIYECSNQECESEHFNYNFYADLDGNLFKGYPC